MLPAITTTHAIPRHTSAVRISLRTTIICRHCFQTLGSAVDLKERRSMEAKHKCGEKLLAEQPAIAIPFS